VTQLPQDTKDMKVVLVDRDVSMQLQQYPEGFTEEDKQRVSPMFAEFRSLAQSFPYNYCPIISASLALVFLTPLIILGLLLTLSTDDIDTASYLLSILTVLFLFLTVLGLTAYWSVASTKRYRMLHAKACAIFCHAHNIAELNGTQVRLRPGEGGKWLEAHKITLEESRMSLIQVPQANYTPQVASAGAAHGSLLQHPNAPLISNEQQISPIPGMQRSGSQREPFLNNAYGPAAPRATGNMSPFYIS